MTLRDQNGSQYVQREVQFRAKPDASLFDMIEEAVSVEHLRAGILIAGLGAGLIS